MSRLKLTIKSITRRTFHMLPLNTRQKIKLKNMVYRNFSFLLRNTEMYRAWERTQPSHVSLMDEIATTLYEKKTVDMDLKDEFISDLFINSRSKSKEFVELSKEKFNLQEDDVKLIAFYLPQFHPIPENDKWWGKGFTEWTNVTKAVPQFLGHHQPQLPVDIGFYDLRMIEVMEHQIELANKYGVFGFCFYHYWFDGKRLLEKPVDNLLANPQLDLPFCLCWANENWTRRWDGQEREILIAQNHTPEGDIAFIKDLEKYITDKRYIKVNGKPLILVYRPQILPNPVETTKRWRDYCRSAGIGEIYLVGAKTFGLQDPTELGFDAAVEFPPHVMYSSIITDKVGIINPDFDGIVYDYEEHVKSKRYLSEDPCTTFKTVIPSWDNTARMPLKGHIFYGSNPKLYNEWLTNVIRHTKEKNDENNQFVFINAWNEWAEGTHLEPDRRYGYGYLEATKKALINIRNEYQIKKSGVVRKDNQTVSIIAPAYNHSQYIEECILSIANQTYPHKELIVIDDCSSDDTADKIKELVNKDEIKSKFSEGITFIQHNSNVGAHQTINEGLEKAKGDYLAIINTDDMYESNRLEVMINELIRQDNALAYSRVKVVDEEGEFYYGDEAKYYEKLQDGLENMPGVITRLINENIAVSTGNLLFTKELFKSVGRFNDYKYIHDWDFILRASLLTEPVFVKETNYLYRLHRSNSFKELQEDVQSTDEEVEKVLVNIFRQLIDGNYSNDNIPDIKELNNVITNPLFKQLQAEEKERMHSK